MRTMQRSIHLFGERDGHRAPDWSLYTDVETRMIDHRGGRPPSYGVVGIRKDGNAELITTCNKRETAEVISLIFRAEIDANAVNEVEGRKVPLAEAAQSRPIAYTDVEGGKIYPWPGEGERKPVCAHTVFMDNGAVFDISYAEYGFLREVLKSPAIKKIAEHVKPMKGPEPEPYKRASVEAEKAGRPEPIDAEVISDGEGFMPEPIVLGVYDGAE